MFVLLRRKRTRPDPKIFNRLWENLTVELYAYMGLDRPKHHEIGKTHSLNGITKFGMRHESWKEKNDEWWRTSQSFVLSLLLLSQRSFESRLSWLKVGLKVKGGKESFVYTAKCNFHKAAGVEKCGFSYTLWWHFFSTILFSTVPVSVQNIC